MIIQTDKQMRDRDCFEHYPTPYELCLAALKESRLTAFPSMNLSILDPGAGTGVWGEAARTIWPNAHITGIELRDTVTHPTAYDTWLTSNYITTQFVDRKFDLIIGNPPYGDVWEQEQRRLKKEAKRRREYYVRPKRPADQPMADAEAFTRKALSELAMGGSLVFLLRLAFLEGQNRSEKFWPTHCPEKVLTLSKRPSFTGNGKTDATAYSMFYWSINNSHSEYYKGGWLKW